MAFFSKKFVFLILITLALVSLALRYPLVEHERYQTDSYTMHLFTQSIIDNERAIWTFHILSYFGYYPFSYPPGSPFLVAELSLLTGLSVELSVLLLGMSLGVAFVIAVFCLSRSFLWRNEFALLASLFAVLGPRFVDTTYWNESARGVFIVLAVVTVMIAFQAASGRQRVFYPLLVIAAFGCLTLHHMAVLLAVIGAAYLMAAFPSIYLIPRTKGSPRRTVVIYFLGIAGTVAFASFLLVEYAGSLAIMNLRESAIFSMENSILVSVLVNAGIAYTSQIGVIFPIAILGLVGIFRNSYLTTKTMFLPAILVVFIPMIGNPIYVSMLLLPFVALVASTVLSRFYRASKSKSVAAFAMMILVTSSMALPVWSTDRWNSVQHTTGDTVEVTNQIFNDARYISSEYAGITAVANTDVLSWQLAALSKTRFLKSGIPMVLTGHITAEDLKGNVSFSDSAFPLNLYVWYEYENQPNADQFVLILFIRGIQTILKPTGIVSTSHDLLLPQSKVLVVVDNNWPNHYAFVYGVFESTFLREIKDATGYSLQEQGLDAMHMASYLTYSTERISVYATEIPSQM